MLNVSRMGGMACARPRRVGICWPILPSPEFYARPRSAERDQAARLHSIAFSDECQPAQRFLVVIASFLRAFRQAHLIVRQLLEGNGLQQMRDAVQART